MYFLRARTNFSAALYLSNSKGKLKSMHGHDYSVTAVLKSESLNRQGMVWDYDSLQKELDKVSSSLDHILLNDRKEFIDNNPTVENIARYFYDSLQNIEGLPIYEVVVSQSTGFEAVYRPMNV